MNLYFRMLWIIISGLWRSGRPSDDKRTNLLAPSIRKFRVLFHDIDVNIHLNNGRYLTFMDLGRIDLMLETKLLGQVVKRGWIPLVGAAVITYRRPIGLLKAFELRSQIAFWDEKWFYVKQEFHAGGHLAATGFVKVCLGKRPHGTVPTKEILEAIGFSGTPPVPAKQVEQIFGLKHEYFKNEQK